MEKKYFKVNLPSDMDDLLEGIGEGICAYMENPNDYKLLDDPYYFGSLIVIAANDSTYYPNLIKDGDRIKVECMGKGRRPVLHKDEFMMYSKLTNPKDNKDKIIQLMRKHMGRKPL